MKRNVLDQSISLCVGNLQNSKTPKTQDSIELSLITF